MSDWITSLGWDNLNDERPTPHAFVQWKGTDICMDVRCDCGDSFHIDDFFAYFVKCKSCGRVYETPCFIPLRAIDPEDSRVFSPKTDDDQVTS